MKSLFLRIFLSYWLAQALFMVLAIIIITTLRPSREIANLQSEETTFLSDAVQAYRTGGEDATWKYLRGVHEAHHVRFFVADENGRDLAGRKPPEWVRRAQLGEMRTAESFLGRLGPPQFLRSSMTTPDGHHYTLVIELPAPPSGMFGPHGLPVFVGILSSGLVCYLLARYLTSPIARLRAATQKLAEGDLGARAGVPQSGRHDELAELMRDFNRMAERIEKLVNAQRRLLTDISHELRSPLARLNVALELARQRSGSEAGSALDRIDRETNRLNQLIQKLLTIARLDGGDEFIQKSPLHLEHLITEIAKDAAFEAQDRRCEVEVDVVDDCVVTGNARLLQSAIENVVRNAVRYTEPGTSVQVRLEQGMGIKGPEAVVRVTDSGPGVPEQALDKLFLPFYRIDDARVRQTGGVGLGLAITERAVALHGGAIRAVNRPQGGLMIEIRLPLAPEAGEDVSTRIADVVSTAERG
jgi:two-component system sensor histidine kinase CpxA